MERTNFSSFNIDRLNLIAIEAIEQSEQMRIPSIFEPIKFEELLSRDQKDHITLVCSVEENSNSIRNVLKNHRASDAMALGAYYKIPILVRKKLLKEQMEA